ncbi:MAG TPA: carboxypeptidase regulatory-like domain-containing protein [Candidatus Angelobacter sp.]|nr:carboxypeptidase regulatory-like domain-containing protein [Candidatus Angelobacter sp.]
MVPKLRHISAVISILAVLLLAGIAFGQVLKGSISGTATDPQGAVLPGAQVKATNLATGAAYTTKSDNSGLFRFSLIPAGEYKVEVSATGFNTAVLGNVVVAAGRDSGLGSIKLAVGQASTTVEVTATAPLIESTQAQVTNTFAGTQLSSFAGVQENEGLDNLALFVPGVSSARDNGFSNSNGGLGFSSNGLRGRNNDQQIDGQNNNDNSVAGPALFLTDPEFVNQYVLVTNQFGPEYGRNSGSVVNIITKSGGNTWHGSIYGNENNSVLNSMTNFEKNFDTDINGNPLTKPPRSNDEFTGFTIGGPMVKNKLFFFGGFDQEDISQNTVFSSGNLTPTPTGLATLAACPSVNPAALQAVTKSGPFGISGGNPIPLPDPTTGQFTTLDITDATGAVVCPGVQFGGVGRTLPTPSHIFDWIARTDWQTSNNTLTARYLFNRNNNFNTQDNGAAGYVVNVPALSQAILLSWTHNFGARMVNEARGSFGRSNVEFGGNTIGNTDPTAQSLAQGVTNITFASPGLLGFGPATNLPQQRIVNTWQAQDNWNYVLGKHQLKAGVNYTFQRSPNIFLPNINGQFRFADWSAFFLNTPNRVNVANGPSSLDFREHDTFLYAGDDWKMAQNLTLNLGLTWSYYGQPANLFNDLTTARESNPATAFWNPALPLSVRTFPRIPAVKTSFGPSFGFAWSPHFGGFLTGNGKTVIRGGYRLLYDPPFYNIYLNMASSAPEVFLQNFQLPLGAPLATAQFGLPAVPTGPNVRALLAPALTPGVLDPRSQAETNVAPDFGPDRVHSWSLGIQREITKNSAVEARYVGNAARGLFQSLNGNPFLGDPTGTLLPGLSQLFPQFVPAGLTPCTTPVIPPATPGGAPPDLGRANCGQGVVRVRANTGFSNYNAIQAEFRANNLFNQLTVRTSYTFSKTLDNASEIFSTFGAGNSVAFSQNPLNFTNGEYGLSGLDFPHQWSMLFTEQLPFFKNQHGLMGHLLGGWAVSGNYLVASGQHYTPSQLFVASATAPGDFFDANFLGAFLGTDSARPFLGNPSAPVTQVGIFAGDACGAFGVAAACSLPAAQLISMNGLNSASTAVTPVTSNNVRYIINGGTAESIFHTPFGNVPRNAEQDAISNIGNLSVFKNIKLSERVAFEFHATALNVLNHPNFQSIDPFLEDAGLFSNLTGFGNPAVSDTQPRTLIFGGRISF